MNDKQLAYELGATNSDKIGLAIEDLVSAALIKRRKHERRWFDNNYFDDGLHFRMVSRRTGRVIDHLATTGANVERAIPRASRQIRGVTNLLFAPEPFPIVYPENITVEQFRDPRTGQVDGQAYQQAYERAKQVARRRGNWLTNEWDEQDLELKLIEATILATKNSIGYIKVWGDPDEQKIYTSTRDAFDIICYGERKNIDDLPFMTDTTPMLITEARNNEMFDPAMAAKLTADNRYATSEIKQAYMNQRFGASTNSNEQATIIIKETYMKEYLSERNWKMAAKMDAGGAMEGKSKSDMIMRHTFSAGGVTLRDEYVDLDKYPYADFRMEPGPLYQTPLIERFIPQNKSLDIVVSRLERWVNSMVVGVYSRRKGENWQISNFAGGQVIDYEATPPTQMDIANVGSTPFNVAGLLDKYIEEQGAASSALNSLPDGVKSGVAIESVKATEYANLKIATLMLKNGIQRVSELLLENGHKHILQPQEVQQFEDNEPDYFSVIGERGKNLMDQLGKPLPPDVVPIKKDVKVRIEIQPGLGITMQGKQNAMQQIIDYFLNLMKVNPDFVSVDAMKMIIKRFMDTYGFGSTQEIMEAMEVGMSNAQMTEDQIQKMKVAMAETLQETGAVGQEAQKNMVDSTKVGTLEAMKDSGILDKQEPQVDPEAEIRAKILESISYKDAPASIQRQLEALAGLQPATEVNISPSEATVTKTVADAHKAVNPPIKVANSNGHNQTSA